MELTEKQKMLGTALYMRHVSKQTTVVIMMTLETEDQIDDFTWYIGQNPQASEQQLIAVAYQLVKEAKEN